MRTHGTCRCLEEIRAGKKRTKFCFVACAAQKAILEEEAKRKQQPQTNVKRYRDDA